MTLIIELNNAAEKSATCAALIDKLPDRFGMPEASARYVPGVAGFNAFVAKDDAGAIIGMLSLRFPFRGNADIFWLGVIPVRHRHGIGRALVEAATERAIDHGCATMTVETLGPSHPDEGYRRTRAFYTAMGFAPLFELNEGTDNPQIYMLKQLGG